MARNKYPEQTINLILDVSLKLFLEKGYEKTTIQDIVNNLNGLSKGALYHHFKSKAEIFEAVTYRSFDESSNLDDILSREDLTGLEKGKLILMNNSNDSKSKSFLPNLKIYLANPELFMKYMHTTLNENAKGITLVINEGIEDGSIKTDYPEELAQVLSLLFNIYSNPLVFVQTKAEFKRKLEFIQFLLNNLNVPLVDDEVIESLLIYMEDVLI